MGKRRKDRANSNLFKDVHSYNQLRNSHGVKHENQFKHCNASNKNIKKKCQKLQVEKLFEEYDEPIVVIDLSASMNGLNISAIDVLDTDKVEDKDAFNDSVIMLDASTVNIVDNSVIMLDSSTIIIEDVKENKKNESSDLTMQNFIVLDETFEEEIKEVKSTFKESTKSIVKTVPKLNTSQKEREVSSKENVKPPKQSTKISNNDKKPKKSNKGKQGHMEKVLPLADATNNQSRKQFSHNSFSEIERTTQGLNAKNKDDNFDSLLKEYKSLRAADKSTKGLHKSTKTKNNKRTDEELHDLNISHLENIKASLQHELSKEVTYKLRESYVPEPDMNESMEKYGRNYYAPKKPVKTKLRPIYIDGSNVAFSHSHGKYFSVTGLKICIDYFLKRGHEVHAFVPHFRKNKCSNPVLFEQLIQNGLIITTPSRYLNGRNLTPYDDRYIVKCAAVNKGVIVSCDNYRDLIQENPSLAPVIEKRLLMPMWVKDMLIFPDDPLGRNGPSLEKFLRF